MLLDNCEQWAHTAQVLLHDVCDVPFRYGAFDICSSQRRNSRGDFVLMPNYAFKKVSIVCCQSQLIPVWLLYNNIIILNFEKQRFFNKHPLPQENYCHGLNAMALVQEQRV